MKTIKTDICIIGAGPAGATTSLFLCKLKIPHVILDAQTFPRDKVCGDGLDLKVMRVLNNLQPGLAEKELLNNENVTQTKGVVINISEKKKAVISYIPGKGQPDLPYFLFSKRAYFDNYLVSKIDHNYATLLQQTRVDKVLGEGNDRIITATNGGGKVEIHTKLMVAADGDHSAVLRSLGARSIDREHYSGGLRQYWSGISDLQPNNYLELYLPKFLPFAYFWIFPLPNGEANVGCGLISSLVVKNKVNLKDVLHEIITNDPVMKQRFVNATSLEKPMGWGLPMASLRRKVSGPGYLLTGDAASLINPTTGEGIGPAMVSGYMAAHFIQRAVQTNNFSEETFSNYDREVYKSLKGSIRANWLLRKTSPAIYNFFINQFGSTELCRQYFQKNVVKWIDTAMNKKIEVKID